jgi:preprotein translocase subunit SecE
MAKGDKKIVGRKRSQNAVQRYFSETVGELRKVSWPSRKEAINLTIVVVIVIIVMSIFLGSLDFIYGQFFDWILF